MRSSRNKLGFLSPYHALCAVSCAMFVALNCGNAIAATDLARIEGAWRDRQEASQYLHVVWEEAWVNRPAPAAEEIATRPLDELPEMLHKAPELALYLSGDKARFETYFIAVQQGELRRTVSVFNFNDGQARTLNYSAPVPTGIIREPSQASFASLMSVQPLLLTYRGCNERLCSPNLSRFHLVADEGRTAQREIELLYNDAASGMEWRLILDPALDFVPVKLLASKGGAMIYELITVFARSADRRVVPESWSASLFDPKGLLLSAARAKVKEIVQDAPPDDSLFDLVFPEGTMVDDIRPHADGGTGHRRFIVVQGKERVVTDEEILRDATYEELVRTKSGQAALELPVRPWFNWILAINVIVVVVLSCAVFIRRRKSAAHGL